MGRAVGKCSGIVLNQSMNEEIFDVVDDNDNVVGTAGRLEVHREGLKHRAVHILVFDHQDRVLVQLRGFNKDCSPGMWDTSAGGHVDSQEDYQTAATRELAEELGVISEGPLEYLFQLPASENTGQEFIKVYKVMTGQVPILQASELAAARWVTKSELKAWIKRDRSQFTKVFLKICTEIGLI